MSPSRSSQPTQAKTIISAGSVLLNGRFATGTARSAPPARISHPVKRSPRLPETQPARRGRVNFRQTARIRMQKLRTPHQPRPWIRSEVAAAGRTGRARPVPICQPTAMNVSPPIMVSGPSENGWTKGTASRRAAKQKLELPSRSSISPRRIPSPRAWPRHASRAESRESSAGCVIGMVVPTDKPSPGNINPASRGPGDSFGSCQRPSGRA